MMSPRWKFRILLGMLVAVVVAISAVCQLKPETPPALLTENSNKLLMRWKKQLAEFWNDRRYDKCELLLRRILKIEPDNIVMQRLLGKIWYETIELDKAANLYRELLLRHPKDAISRNNYGMILCANQQFEAGIKELDNAYSASGERRFIGLNWAAMLWRMGDRRAAREVFVRCRATDSKPVPWDAVVASEMELIALEQL